MDNGIYSGVLRPTGETFVLVVINNYAIANQYSIPKSISQFKYSVDTYGNVSFGWRVKVGDSSFPDGWKIINVREIDEMMNEYFEYLIKYVDDKSYTPETVGISGSMTIDPNKYYKFDNISNLNVDFGNEKKGVMNNYMFQIEVVSPPEGSEINISIDEDIKWANGKAPNFEVGKIYQISVINNLGVFTEFQ